MCLQISPQPWRRRGGFVGRGTDSNSPEEIFYSNETNPHFSLDLDANARTWDFPFGRLPKMSCRRPEAKSREVMTWIHKTFKRGWGPSNYKTDSWWHHTAGFCSCRWKISWELAGTRLGSSFKSPLNPIQVDVDIFKVGTWPCSSWTLVSVGDSKYGVLDSLASPGGTQADSHFEGKRQRALNCLDMRLDRHTTNQSNDACNACSGATSLELSTGRCTLCDFRAALDKKTTKRGDVFGHGSKKTLVSRHTVWQSPGVDVVTVLRAKIACDKHLKVPDI